MAAAAAPRRPRAPTAATMRRAAACVALLAAVCAVHATPLDDYVRARRRPPRISSQLTRAPGAGRAPGSMGVWGGRADAADAAMDAARR